MFFARAADKLYHFLGVLVYQEMNSGNLGCRIYVQAFCLKAVGCLARRYCCCVRYDSSCLCLPSQTPKLTRDRYRRAPPSTLYADTSCNRSSSRSFRLRGSTILPLLLCVRYSYASYYRKNCSSTRSSTACVWHENTSKHKQGPSSLL